MKLYILYRMSGMFSSRVVGVFTSKDLAEEARLSLVKPDDNPEHDSYGLAHGIDYFFVIVNADEVTSD